MGVQGYFTILKHCALDKRNPTLTTSLQLFNASYWNTQVLSHSWNYLIEKACSAPVLKAHHTGHYGWHLLMQLWFLVCVASSHSLCGKLCFRRLKKHLRNRLQLQYNIIFEKYINLELSASCFSPILYCSIISIFIFSGSCYQNLHNRDELPHTANMCEHLLATTGHEPARKLNSDPT